MACLTRLTGVQRHMYFKVFVPKPCTFISGILRWSDDCFEGHSAAEGRLAVRCGLKPCIDANRI